MFSNIEAVPLIRASQVRPFLAAMDCIGTPRERLLRQSKLSLFAYDDAEAVVPELFLWGLADKVARKEGIEDFGLVVAAHTPVWKSEPELTSLLKSSLTLWIALSRFCQLSAQFSNSVRFEITRESNQALLKCYQSPSAPGEDQSELYSLAVMVQLVQLAAGLKWAPSEICVSAGNAQLLARCKAYGDVRIQRSDTFSCVAFPVDMLAWPMQGLEQPCAPKLPDPLADTFIDSLGAIISTYLHYRVMNIQLAAEMAGLSRRTFQRRLTDVQLDYSTLIDRVRLKLALESLRNSDVPLTAIAYDLGYSDAAHFTRAFRRWTALSPSEYRHQTPVV